MVGTSRCKGFSEGLVKARVVKAMAAHNNGGLVIVQVERLAVAGSLKARDVHIPGALVDKVVVAAPKLHQQFLRVAESDGSLTGQVQRPLQQIEALPLAARKIVGHRCMLAISKPSALVNLGVGMPEAVAVMVNSYAERDCPHVLPITLCTEVGVFGGLPAGGSRFGAAYNAAAWTSCSTMIDLIQGGGLDVAILGCAEVDEEGNANVSKFSGRHPGCGGFIDISQSARTVIFAGTFTSGGLEVAVASNGLRIAQEGTVRKFRKAVQQKTFAGASARGRTVLYVTERCVFRLLEASGTSPRVQLEEVAPGIRLQEDILDLMDFQPLIGNLKLMDPRCFQP